MIELAKIFHHVQRQLFAMLEEEIGTLSELDRQFCEVISLTDLGRFTRPYEWCGNGAPPHARVWLVHAFIAKSVYQFPTTTALVDALRSRPMLRRLCGWESVGEVPSEPTFSRAFAAFAVDGLPQQIHEHMVKVHAGPKLVGHISRDATAIEAPERPVAKPAPVEKAPRKRGRPKKGETRPPPPLKRLELQGPRSLEANLADLPSACDVGTKCNSKGYKTSWIGYKLHLDTIDGDLPVSAVLTSASVHDSQVAIPLAQMALHLLQNCMVYINTLMLQRVLAQPHWNSKLTPRDLSALTPLIWEHVNPVRTRHECPSTTAVKRTKWRLVTRLLGLPQQRL